MTRMTIELPEPEASRLTEVSKSEKRSKLEIVRRAIALYARLRKLNAISVIVETPQGKHEISFI